MKKIISLGLAFAMMATMATGCGTKDTATDTSKTSTAASSESKTSTTEPGKVTTLNFWTFQELHKGFFDDATVTWNKANPDNQIELKTDVYPYDENHNKLLIALQSGTGAPDLVDIESGKFPNYLKGSKPGLVELNRVVDPIKDKLIMGRMDNYAKDGKYYGVDYHVGAQVIYYNKDILDAAGVNADSIKTWDDYIAAGKTVLEKTGKPMATIETTEHWSYYPLITMQGSDFLTKDGVPQLDNDVNIKSLQMLKDMMYKDKIVVAAPGGFHHSEEYWAWMNKGNAASIWMPMWYMGRFTQYMPDLKGKMIIRPMPTFEGGKKSAGMGGTGTAVTTQSKNIDLAVDFLAAAKLSLEGSIKTWTILGFDPIRSDAWADPAMAADNQYTQYFGKDIFSTLQSIVGDIGPINYGDLYPAALTLVQKNVMFKVLKEQSQTPEQALKEANEELKKK
ncbi:MAG: ABC transporter substrate-binding protein [Ruminiclostridium sp.]